MPMRFRSMLFLLMLLALALNLAAQELPTPEDDEEQQWLLRKLEEGESHASGMRPELGPVTLGNPTEAVRIIRVGLSPTTFNSAGGVITEMAGGTNPAHLSADISNTVGTVHVLDLSTGKQIIDIEPGTIVHVRHIANAGYEVSIAGAPLGVFGGPVFFKPTDATNLFRVENIRRIFNGTKVPTYRGAIEVTRGQSLPAQGLVYVVNVVEIEDYVPGVVVNEGLSSFHIEALKAQAVAARGYAISNRGRFATSRNLDIFDSTSSQVYRGVISENAKAVQAASETYGLVGSYDGKIIEALYSSSMGGRTENNEWIFNSPPSALPGTNAAAYLRGIFDGVGTPPDPLDETFWRMSQPQNIYDGCPFYTSNGLSRWTFKLTAAQLAARLGTTRTIRNVEVLQRMDASGRIAVVRVWLDVGSVDVRGWSSVRSVFGRNPSSIPRACGGTLAAGTSLNAPNFIDVNRDLSGNLIDVTVWGGGFGHNVGMSQYGAHGRASKALQNFVEILKAYYTGIDVGTYPIDIGRDTVSGPPTLRHTFYAPRQSAKLIIRSTDLKKLVVHINETYDFSFDEAALAAGTVTMDVSPYIVPGLNTLQYNPVGKDGKATVIVAVD